MWSLKSLCQYLHGTTNLDIHPNQVKFAFGWTGARMGDKYYQKAETVEDHNILASCQIVQHSGACQNHEQKGSRARNFWDSVDTFWSGRLYGG